MRSQDWGGVGLTLSLKRISQAASLWEPTQSFQKPLAKEYTSSYNKEPYVILGLFVNEGLLKAPATQVVLKHDHWPSSLLSGPSPGCPARNSFELAYHDRD